MKKEEKYFIWKLHGETATVKWNLLCVTRKLKLLTREKYQWAGRSQEENFRAYENKLAHQTN